MSGIYDQIVLLVTDLTDLSHFISLQLYWHADMHVRTNLPTRASTNPHSFNYFMFYSGFSVTFLNWKEIILVTEYWVKEINALSNKLVKILMAAGFLIPNNSLVFFRVCFPWDVLHQKLVTTLSWNFVTHMTSIVSYGLQKKSD